MIEIHWGIREKAKFLDVMRDLTATVEAGFAVSEKKTAFGVDIRRSSGCEIVLKKSGNAESGLNSARRCVLNAHVLRDQ